jgi:predicted extracellular nuclease
MKKSAFLLVFVIFSISLFSKCVDDNEKYYFVAFWNLENLFDTTDDSDKNDEDFLPTGKKEWTEERLERKMFNLARIIRSMNNDMGPDILGVCEIEHQYLLDSMTSNFLSDFNYNSIGTESPDNRGIDNGLIYKADKFQLISFTADTVLLDAGTNTRPILYVQLLTNFQDTLHVFVNHFPSRGGGQEITEPNRIKAAQTLRNAVDRVLNKNANAKILVLGDFNDEPTNRSMLETLSAAPFQCDSLNGDGLYEDTISDLFNTSFTKYKEGIGSFKYRDDWNMLDQIIISKELIIGNSLKYECGSFEVYKPDLMVTQSGKYKGSPFPTYGGIRYLGGFSDHFAVSLKLRIMR